MSFSDEWFEGVYGKEPYPQQSAETLLSEIHYANKHLLNSESRLLERQLWEARRDGARAAWRKLERENVAKRLADDEADNIHRAMVVLVNVLGDCSVLRPLGVAEAVASKVRGLEYRVKELEAAAGQGEALGSIVRDPINSELRVAQVQTLIAEVKELEAELEQERAARRQAEKVTEAARRDAWYSGSTIREALQRIIPDVPCNNLNTLAIVQEIEHKVKELGVAAVQAEALEKSRQDLADAYINAIKERAHYAKPASYLTVSNELLRGKLEEAETTPGVPRNG